MPPTPTQSLVTPNGSIDVVRCARLKSCGAHLVYLSNGMVRPLHCGTVFRRYTWSHGKSHRCTIFITSTSSHIHLYILVFFLLFETTTNIHAYMCRPSFPYFFSASPIFRNRYLRC
uniref:Uncharacterized protein n=1 Tax=Trypanosoma vivax (strain Y486) TaxID=1055687 RepID=G0TX95_TRYVY|nr:hypothetical protein TVY486_0603760 [Trypanosoma vivax Y486]